MAQPPAACKAEPLALLLFHAGLAQQGQLCARSVLCEFTPGLLRVGLCQEVHRCKLDQYTWCWGGEGVSAEGFARLLPDWL